MARSEIHLTNANTRAALCGRHTSARAACNKFNTDAFYAAQNKSAAIEGGAVVIRHNGEIIDTYIITVLSAPSRSDRIDADRPLYRSAEEAWENEDEQAWLTMGGR